MVERVKGRQRRKKEIFWKHVVPPEQRQRKHKHGDIHQRARTYFYSVFVTGSVSSWKMCSWVSATQITTHWIFNISRITWKWYDRAVLGNTQISPYEIWAWLSLFLLCKYNKMIPYCIFILFIYSFSACEADHTVFEPNSLWSAQCEPPRDGQGFALLREALEAGKPWLLIQLLKLDSWIMQRYKEMIVRNTCVCMCGRHNWHWRCCRGPGWSELCAAQPFHALKFKWNYSELK